MENCKISSSLGQVSLIHFSKKIVNLAENQRMSKRKTINYGYRWVRFIFILPIIGAIFEFFSEDSKLAYSILYLLIFIGLYLLFWMARRLKHDDENFYIMRGSKEKVVHFSKIISIKRSKTKVNSERFWILRYKDDLEKERTVWYFASFTKEFRESVQKVNPDVIIWTHPHFNH